MQQTIVTEAGGYVVPPCPAWCILPADHHLGDEEPLRELDGTVTRAHEAARWKLAADLGEPAEVTIEQFETIGRDGKLDPVVLYVKAENEFSPAQARQLAAALIEAADRLDVIRGA